MEEIRLVFVESHLRAMVSLERYFHETEHCDHSVERNGAGPLPLFCGMVHCGLRILQFMSLVSVVIYNLSNRSGFSALDFTRGKKYRNQGDWLTA